MAAAEHGADFPMAKNLRKSMSHNQLHDFAVGSMKNKPEHILKGSSPDVMHQNKKAFKSKGMTELEATKRSIKASHPNRHKNLKGFLHPKGKGKASTKPVDKPEYPGDLQD